jgi:glycyl-tRNA synthetase (class II)
MINDVSEGHTASKTSVSAYYNTRCYNVEDSNMIFHCREPFQGHEDKTTYKLTRHMRSAYGDMACV